MTLAKYGRYEALHRIASGGMASVYLGRHVGAGGFERLVAIKVMHDHIAEDPSFSAMFLDEARLAAQIRHPNVVPTLDVADDGRYIVMEYVEGASLQAILRSRKQKKQGPVPLPVALRIFLDALAGLHAAHELQDSKGQPLNLVHRDISPHNVLVGVDGMARITDFGIAFAEARLTSTKSGQLKGKLPYMAPEQLEDDAVTRTTDVYAAGCVLWEMLAGQRLFRGKSEAAVACAVLAGPERRVIDVRPDIPKAIDEACMRALTRAETRYATALEFAEVLENAADASGTPIARHRKVGPVARLEEMTYPAASTLTDSDDDPRPRELMEELAGAASEPVPSAPTAVTRESAATAIAAAATTLASEPGASSEPASGTVVERTRRAAIADPVAPGQTTLEDRPPPEVAAVIRAAYESQEPDETVSPVSGPALEFDDTSVVIPKERNWGSLMAAGVVAIGLSGGIIWMATRQEPTQALDHAASSDTASAAAAPSPEVASAPSPVPSSTSSARAAASTAPSVSPPIVSSAGGPLPPRTGKLPAAPPPAPPPIQPSPAPGGEYHPDAP